MRAIVILIVALVVPAAPLWAQAAEETVYVSVLDKSDAPVTGLGPNEFIVRENDIAREVLRASAATEPLQIALLVDTSQAVEPHVLDVRTALAAFFKQMGGKHEIALVGVGERPTVLVDFTRDTARLQKGIGSIYARTGSGTYILDAIMETAESLRRREPARGDAPRRHIVVYSSRGPEFSERYHQNVLDVLRESGATLHSFVLNKPGASLRNREEQELEMTLAQGTRMSGGRRDDLLTPMSLTDRLQALGNELQNQHRVVYARPKTLLPPKSMEVSVKRPGLTARARRWP